MTSRDLDQLLEQLSERDLKILLDLERYRLATTGHLQRLHFPVTPPTPETEDDAQNRTSTGHTSTAAATRACTRVLARLAGRGLVASLERRIGGVRHGSAGTSWHLGPTGERLTRRLSGATARRRFLEPSRSFWRHTLAVTEVAVHLTEAHRRSHATHGGQWKIERLDVEPTCWQPYLTPGGTRTHLKPDLRLTTIVRDQDGGEYEEHWFCEIDRGTESTLTLLRQCHRYHTHHTSGRYQVEHEVYPRVLWLMPTANRAERVRAAIARDPRLTSELFTVTTTAEGLAILTGEQPKQAH